MEAFGWAKMLGGLALFFYGLQMGRDGLKLAAGERLKSLMGKFTTNRLVALALGAVVTFLLQSSSATTVILVSFAESQLITLAQAFGVILGADIGTTLVVILLSFKKITEYALYILVIGLVMQKITRSQKLRYMGQVVMGFGMLFFGMGLMAAAAAPLHESPAAMHIFAFLAEHPIWNLLFAAIFTSIIQTSAATIGIAIALSFSGVLTFEAAIPIVLGANVGTCITACLSCFGMGVPGRRVAIAHVMIKVIGVALVFPFISQAATLIDKLSAYLGESLMFVMPTSGKIALTHLLFNIFVALLFLPLVKPGVWFVEKLVPSRKRGREEFGPKYLDEKALETPPLAFAQAFRELHRTANIAHDMFRDILELFKMDVDFERAADHLGSADDKIDTLEKAVRFFLSKVSESELTENQARTQVSLLTQGGDIEDIGDIMSKDVLTLAKKKRGKVVRFSEEGWAELKKFHDLVLKNFDLTISMLAHPHEDIAQKMARHKVHLGEMEQTMRMSHIQRLHDKLPETYETSSIHLDLMSCMRAINTKLLRVVQTAGQVS
jgi:phosphate:Na+ symporter